MKLSTFILEQSPPSSSAVYSYIPHLDAGSDVTEVLKSTLVVRDDENVCQRVYALKCNHQHRG